MAEIDDKELAELRKQANNAAKNAAMVEALQAKLATAETAAARVAELEAEVTTFKAAQVEATFTGAGISDAKIRRVFQLEFDEQAAGEGGQKDLGAWLKGLVEAPADKRPAHLAPFLPAPGKAAGGAGGNGAGTGAGQRRGVLGDENKNTRGVEDPAPEFTPEKIASMTPQEFAAALPRLAQAEPALAGFQLPPSLRPPAGATAGS